MAGKGEAFKRDRQITGFAVRCRKAAGDSFIRTFFFEYQPPEIAGQKPPRKKISLGDWPTLTADEAREKARLMAQQLKDGIDPATMLAKKKAEPVFEELWTQFKEEHLSLKGEGTQKDYSGRYRRVLLPAFKGRKVSSITRGEVNALRAKHAPKKTEVNRSFAVGSKMFSFAIMSEFCENNPFKGVQRFTEKRKEAWLDEDALPRFVAALLKAEGPRGDLLRFLCCTGWRVSAARFLRFDQVDLMRLECHLEDSETKKTATALAPDAATLIQRQPHKFGYVFSNTKGREPICYKKVLEGLGEVCEAAGLERVTPHTLRRTLATHAAIGGATVPELMAAFGWSGPAMAIRYVQKSKSLAKQAVESNAALVNVLGKHSAEVIELPRRQI